MEGQEEDFNVPLKGIGGHSHSKITLSPIFLQLTDVDVLRCLRVARIPEVNIQQDPSLEQEGCPNHSHGALIKWFSSSVSTSEYPTDLRDGRQRTEAT